MQTINPYSGRPNLPPILPPPHAYRSRPPRTWRERLTLVFVAAVAAAAGVVVTYTMVTAVLYVVLTTAGHIIIGVP